MRAAGAVGFANADAGHAAACSARCSALSARSGAQPATCASRLQIDHDTRDGAYCSSDCTNESCDVLPCHTRNLPDATDNFYERVYDNRRFYDEYEYREKQKTPGFPGVLNLTRRFCGASTCQQFSTPRLCANLLIALR